MRRLGLLAMLLPMPAFADASTMPPMVQSCFEAFQEQAVHSMDWHAKALELSAELKAARDELAKLKSAPPAP